MPYRLMGTYVFSDFGAGYAWLPSILNVGEGDYVSWHWDAPGLNTGMVYRVFQTESATGGQDMEGFSGGEEGTEQGEAATGGPAGLQ